MVYGILCEGCGRFIHKKGERFIIIFKRIKGQHNRDLKGKSYCEECERNIDKALKNGKKN